MQHMKFVLPLAAALLTACAQLPKTVENAVPALTRSEAQTQYQNGLTSYRESRLDNALTDLGAAVSSGLLPPQDAIDARKHIAFIHCAGGRELPCREQFQAILKEEPKFDLAASEAVHPVWGPVWRSIKGSLEEKHAVELARSGTGSPAQQKLAEGIKEYDAGRYREALGALQAAIKGGLPEKTDAIRAHKYSAFTYCLTRRTTLCRGEFRKIFALDPAFDLLPSESGHPSWASTYRNEKAAAQNSANAAAKKRLPRPEQSVKQGAKP